LKEYNSRTEPN